jgi:hypothetical protein
MLEEVKNIKVSPRDTRNFGITFSIISLVLALVMLRKGSPGAITFAVFGSVMLLAGFTLPRVLSFPYKMWMALALLLGWVMTRILLFLAFLFIIVPIGIVARLLGKRFLNFNWKTAERSYWERRPPSRGGPENYERQF